MTAREFIEKELLPWLFNGQALGNALSRNADSRATYGIVKDFINTNTDKWQSAQVAEPNTLIVDKDKVYVNPLPLKKIGAYLRGNKEPWFAENKFPPIEPLSLPGSILPYKHGKVTGKDVLDMLLPVINKQEEIIARLAEKGI